MRCSGERVRYSGAHDVARWPAAGSAAADRRVLVGLVLAVLMLPPLWILLQDSVTTTDAIGDVTGLTFGHFRKLFTDETR